MIQQTSTQMPVQTAVRVPQKKRKLTLEEVNNIRDQRSVFAALSMKDPKYTATGGVINEVLMRITDYPAGSELEKYGVDAYISCIAPYWGENNPRAAWIRDFIERQRDWQQPDVDANERKPPTGWIRLVGLHERKYIDRDGVTQFTLECIALELTGWYGFPEDFMPSPQQPSDEEIKVQKAQAVVEREAAAAQIPAAVLVGDEIAIESF